MTRLSVNVNKVATLRNARGGDVPDLLQAVRVCIAAGAPGITVHPRSDERHIRRADVRAIAALLRAHPNVEFNIEGDPRLDWLELVHEVKPAQATLVPVRAGELTSEAGFDPRADASDLRAQIQQLRAAGIRASVFIDAEQASVAWAKSVGADRVELYTEPFARAFHAGSARASFARYEAAARQAHALALGVNAGHDLDLDNLTVFRQLPHLDEVSIGHALIGRALFVGLERVVKEYLSVLAG